MIRTLIIGIVALAMVSCTAIQSPIMPGGSSVTVTQTADGQTVTQYNGNAYTNDGIMAATNGCRQFVQAKEANRQALAMSINDDQLKAMVVVHGQVTEMVSTVWGSDQCSMGTNEFDAYIAYAEQQGAINRTVIETAGGVAKTGLIAGFTWAGVDSIMGAVGTKVGGDHITSGENTVKAGDVDSSVTKNTELNSQVVNRNTGEVNPLPETPVESEEAAGLPEGFVAPGCSAESRAEGRC